MICIIIQARMGSSRFPGKMLADLAGKPLIWHVIDRMKKVRQADKIVIATSVDKRNITLIEKVKELGFQAYAGSEDDVLDRYYNCARNIGAKVIVRITGDCPLNDPKIIDEVISLYKNKNVDYATNTMPPTFPDGMDVEVFSFESLENAWKNAKLKSEREHVTPYIRNNPSIFKHANLANKENLFNIRLTVDEKEDLILLNAILKELDASCSLDDIINFLKKQPELLDINKMHKRNEGYEKSLKEDKNEV